MSIYVLDAAMGIMSVDTLNELIGKVVTKSNIPIFIKETREIRITDGTSPGENLPSITSTIPVGTIRVFERDSAHSDYLELDGTSLSKTLYPEIYSVFGTTYGEPDSTTFRLPDTRQVFNLETWFYQYNFSMNFWIKYE